MQEVTGHLVLIITSVAPFCFFNREDTNETQALSRRRYHRHEPDMVTRARKLLFFSFAMSLTLSTHFNLSNFVPLMVKPDSSD